MADTTQLTTNVESMTEEIPSSVNNNETRNYKGYLSKPYADYCSSQKLQIELYRLKFLKDCKTCKRPPSSLRIRGASAIKKDTIFKKFSLWETELLNEAIKEKLTLVKRLRKQVSLQNDQPLSDIDKRKIIGHLEKKLAFYTTQNKTKWREWPNKKAKHKTEINYKRKQKRRKKKTGEDMKNALESGSVVILVEKEVPAGAIALLGKGLNFTPTPTINIMEEQLDMRLNTNRILQAANSTCENQGNIKYSVPSKLSHRRYAASKPANENLVNNIVNNIAEEHNGRLQFENNTTRKRNITKDEEEGLRWLVKETQESNIAVVKADKGGAILIVEPELLEKAVLDKLENPNLYQRLAADPTDILHDELFECWVKGKKAGFVTAAEAAKVMGVTENNNKSTSSHFKPGRSYFYPMLKIHKLSKEELIPGVNPPARLVTALQEGVSKRSDVFLADRFLKELEANFCNDLLKDTNSALLWLDSVDNTYTTAEKKHMKSFTFDFKSLYDNLKPDLVREAVQFAMSTCRPGWSEMKRKWILNLIDISLRASIGKFKEYFYLQKNGVPTGGSLCVQLANITVYYVMNKAVYSKPQLMHNVREAKRYIDDGAGFYVGSERSFNAWMNKVNDALNVYGLYIDESVVKDVNEFVPFLDIQFCFDNHGNLQTDLYVKPTDARSYLDFNSAHPNHTFSGIVYSQCLRLRRIINNQDRLTRRLNELCSAFEKSGYPKKMLQNISRKVLSRERQLTRTPIVTEEVNSKPILIVSCHGTDDKLVKTLKTHEDDLLKTNSFKNVSKPVFQFVKKTGSNIGSKLATLKSIALGNKKGKTVPCNAHGNCKCCSLISKEEAIEINGLPVSCAPGNCKTKNTIYLVTCKLCTKPYIGRTVQRLSKRMSGHRECFYKVLGNEEEIDFSSDDYSLGLHLVHEHGCHNTADFNRLYNVQILEICSPSNLEKKEHTYIHRYNTLYPIGLNKINPFGLPILGM